MKKLIVILVMLTLSATSFGELLCELNYNGGLIDDWDYYGPTVLAEMAAAPQTPTPSGNNGYNCNWYMNEGGAHNPVPNPMIWKTVTGPAGGADLAALMDGTRHSYIGLGAATDRLLAGKISMDIAPALPGGAPGSYQWLYTDDPTGDQTNGIQGFCSIALNGSNLEATLLGNYGAANDTFLSASVASWAPGAWHNISVEWDSTVIRLLIDNVEVAVDNAPSIYFASEGVKTGYAYILGHGTAGGYQTFQGGVDNIRVYNVIPEPATIALLGLGGLALLRKKRVS